VPDFRFVRVQDRDLSLWQSAVAEHVREQLGAEAAETDVLAHRLMQAVNDHVEAEPAGGGEAELRPVPGEERQTAA
jgi:hypothetical protein